MSCPTEQEKKLIISFRQRVEVILETPEQKSDHFLLRWIRARDGNLDKAEIMLRNSLKWRKEKDIYNILLKSLDSYISENFMFHDGGKDNEGRPVREVHIGVWDMRKVIDAGKEEEFYLFVNHFFESIIQIIKNSNEGKKEGEWPHTQFVYVLDWEGYSYSQLVHWKAVQSLLTFGSLYEAHYPEILHSAYFVNCPAIMPLFMKLLKPLLAPKTYAKIHVFGSNKDEWETALKNVIHPDLLWSQFGGNRIVSKAKL